MAAAAATSADGDGSRRIRVRRSVVISNCWNHRRTCYLGGNRRKNYCKRKKEGICRTAMRAASNGICAASLHLAAAAQHHNSLCIRRSCELHEGDRSFRVVVHSDTAPYRCGKRHRDAYKQQGQETTHSFNHTRGYQRSADIASRDQPPCRKAHRCRREIY